MENVNPRDPVPSVRAEVIGLRAVRELDEDSMKRLFTWVDQIPLSRPKRNLTRDFSDGVMVAELLRYYLPHIVDLHNYYDASATKAKEYNWFHLNKKVLYKLDMEVSPDAIRAISLCKPHVIEYVLTVLREKIDLHLAKMQGKSIVQFHMLKNWVPGQPMTTSAFMTEVDPRSHSPEYTPSAMDHPHTLHSQSSPTIQSYSSAYPTAQSHQNLNSRHLQSQSETILTQRQELYNKLQMVPIKEEKVPKEDLSELEKECNLKQNVIELLQKKIGQLEHMLHLKDLRIDELTNTVEKLIESGAYQLSPSPRHKADAGAQSQASSRQPQVKHYAQYTYRT